MLAKNIQLWLTRTIQLQLFITIISLPILMYWGLPISMVSPLANIIFAPMLTLFLLLSSLLFFTELLHIPNKVIALLLNYCTEIWEYTLRLADHQWLISFKPPPALFFMIIIACALLMLHYRWHNPWYKVAGLVLLLTISLGSLKAWDFFVRPTNISMPIECNRGTIFLAQCNKNTILVDPGYIGQKITAPDWIEFTLLPMLMKQGITQIDHYIIMQPTIMALQAATRLAQLITIQHCYMTVWQGTSSKGLLRAYGTLRQALQKHSTVIHRIAKQQTINLVDESITLQPLEDTLSYQDCTFQALKVFSVHNPFECYSAYYKLKTL